jgi:restriction system protein
MQHDRQRRSVAYQRGFQQSVRNAERARREHERAVARQERDRAKKYAEMRLAEAAADNDLLDQTVAELIGVLGASLASDHDLDLEALKQQFTPDAFDPGELVKEEAAPVVETFLPPMPTGVTRHLLSTKRQYDQAVRSGREEDAKAHEEWREREQQRLQSLEAARSQHEAAERTRHDDVVAYNQAIDELATRVGRAERNAVTDFVALVLARSHYPEDFPSDCRLVPESKQLVMELELPTFEVVPAVSAYK